MLDDLLRKMSDTEIDRLKEHYKPAQPLGDAVALPELGNERNVLASYFDVANHPYQQLTRNPSMIVGRRGAGKTEMLLSCRLDPRYSPIVFFSSANAEVMFHTVIRTVEQTLYEKYRAPLVEMVSGFWRLLFSITLFDGVVRGQRENSDLDICRTYLTGLGVSLDNAKSDPHKIIIDAIVAYRKEYANSEYASGGVDFMSCFRYLKINGIDFQDVESIVINHLDRQNTKAIILFDSIESLDFKEEWGVTGGSLALQGLVRCIGEFHELGRPFEFRACIPAEIYFYLQRISSNVLKDFRRCHILHWHALEILRICAVRYRLFLALWFRQAYDEKFSSFELESRSGVLRFWRSVLPPTVTNTACHQEEETIPYVLRHTQLLPRHLLLILSQVIADHIAAGRSVTEPVDAGSLTTSIGQAEQEMANQIVGAYETIYANIDNALKAVLPRIGNNIISHSELNKIFNHSSANKYFDKFEPFLQMAAEIGVVGRVISEGNYLTGMFEYSEPHRLLLTEKDTLCIHPIFTETYEAIVPGRIPDNFRPIYPRGVDPDEPDRRQIEEVPFH